jgi:hypothetical protein
MSPPSILHVEPYLVFLSLRALQSNNVIKNYLARYPLSLAIYHPAALLVRLDICCASRTDPALFENELCLLSTARLCIACSRLFTVAVSSGFAVHETLTVRRRIHMVHQVFMMHICTYVAHRCPPPYPALRLKCEGKQSTAHLAFATESRALYNYRSWYSRFTCAAGYRLLYPIWRLLSMWAYLCVDAGSVIPLRRVRGLRCSTCACEGQSHGFVN